MAAHSLAVAKKFPTLRSLSEYAVIDVLRTSDWQPVIFTVVTDSSIRKQKLYAEKASGNLQ